MLQHIQLWTAIIIRQHHLHLFTKEALIYAATEEVIKQATNRHKLVQLKLLKKISSILRQV